MSFEPNYEKQYPVLRHDSDMFGNMKLSALFRYAQQLATDQGLLTGLTPEYYARTHTAYLLAKQALAVTRLPQADELLTYNTMPEQSRHASNKRITLVTDESGKEVACVDSRWILVDTETRRILRRPPQELECRWNPEVPRTLDMLIPKAAETRPAGSIRADYQLCDANGHVNNVNYLDVMCNALPVEVLRQGVRRVAITYHREVPFGETFALRLGEAGGGWYACGEREGLPAFEAYIGL